MEDAIEESGEGCIIHIRVRIGKKNIFPAGYDEWRKRIEIEVNEEPVGGKANKKIVEIVASLLGTGINEVEIVYGKKAREKGVRVKKKKEEVLHILKNGQ